MGVRHQLVWKETVTEADSVSPEEAFLIRHRVPRLERCHPSHRVAPSKQQQTNKQTKLKDGSPFTQENSKTIKYLALNGVIKSKLELFFKALVFLFQPGGVLMLSICRYDAALSALHSANISFTLRLADLCRDQSRCLLQAEVFCLSVFLWKRNTLGAALCIL